MESEETQEQQATEMLNQFELLYNNIGSNQSPGLNPYEISLLLTKAQKEIVKSHFTLKGNKYQEGYDDSRKRHADFASLLCTTTLEAADIDTEDKIDYRSLAYKIPEEADVFLILNEQLMEYKTSDTSKKITGVYTVVAINQDEYASMMQKPYRYPPKNQFWKLDNGNEKDGSHNTFIEIIGVQNKESGYLYRMRYIKNPEPIVLMNLEEVGKGLSIENVSTINPCKLPKHLQDEIVQRAVELAKGVWQGDLNSTIELGQHSE